jgi:ribose/xylose/arabinose/galactoside ABC-type transport system permease subunit
VTPAEIALIAVLVVLWIALAFATPAFLSAGSIIPLLVEVAPVALIGIGMTFIIITGGIDVSVGGAIMVCSVITAKLMRDQGLPVWGCLAVALGTGAVLGLVNGALIAYGRVHAIIITFGTANLFLFLGLQIFGSTPVAGMPNTLAWFGRGIEGRTLGVPNSFAITVILAAIAWWYLRHTPGGRRCGIGGHRSLLARRRSRSVPTATMMKMPTNRSDNCEGQPSCVTPDLTVCTSSAPSRVPSTEPRPPMIDVPPITTAAITASSWPEPTDWSRLEVPLARVKMDASPMSSPVTT